jgi:hypothetical protein
MAQSAGKIIEEKITQAIELTKPSMERYYLIRWIMISAEMQGLIIGWDCDLIDNRFVFDIRLSPPTFSKLLIGVPCELGSSVY